MKSARLAPLSRGLAVYCLATFLTGLPQAKAQEPGPPGEPAGGEEADGEELAQQLTNPVADLVSIPFQYNWRNGVGPDDELQLVLNIQPVVPIGITEDWNLVGRFIVPVISQPAMTEESSARTGLGDGLLSLFASPASDSPFQWGVGPVAALPFTTDPMLGTGQWSAGPTAVGLYMLKGWTFVLLANHLWSITETGDVERADVNQSFVQPAVAYTTDNAWTLSVNSEISINWEAEDGEELTLPINGAVSKLVNFGPLPMSVQLGGGVYAEAPTGGPEWQLRLGFTVLLPAAQKEPAATAAAGCRGGQVAGL